MLVYLCEQLFKVILRTAMFSMLNDYNIILLKKVLNVYYKNNFRKKNKEPNLLEDPFFLLSGYFLLSRCFYNTP